MLKYSSYCLLAVTVLVITGCSGQSDNGPSITTNRDTQLSQNTSNQAPKAVDSPVNKAVNNLPVNSGPTSNLKESTLAAVPAPDNSTFTSTMDKEGNFMEVREFKNDPVIKKVERKVLGRNSKYLVYLKNGKVVEANAEKMTGFRSLAPANILDAIGMLSKPDASPVRNESKVEN
jgi:PBP1b-binding outer membrane lipoprotein LpoB